MPLPFNSDCSVSNKILKKDRPEPINSEISLNHNKVLLSITDTRGIITYANEDFVEASEYKEWELAGSNHNVIRHPDMPRVIFKLMWNRIQNGDNIIAIVKNLSKSGRFYWVMTDFVIREDVDGNIVGYKAFRRPAPRKAIETVIPLYEKLCMIEDAKGVEASENFLIGFLDSKDTTYDDFIETLIIDNISEISIEMEEVKVEGTVKKEERRSFFRRLFDY